MRIESNPPNKKPNLLSELNIVEKPKFANNPIGIKTVETPSEKETAFEKAFSPITFGKIGIIKKRFSGHSPAVNPKTIDEVMVSSILR
ncbi:MAG TPA: hypothetical protein PKK55_05220 [Methanofastidiosum sp.]|jgi:hypothetical protein|nr:hypothetical protein [Methanofastidiosum sp.]